MSTLPQHNSQNTPPELADEHRRMLEVESGISPEIIATRGYFTARRRTEIPDVFSTKQRRLGLVVPLHSPDGETVSYQLRPNKLRYRGPKYLSPTGSTNIVDVHPLMQEAVKDASIPLYLTEGAKSGDALTSRGRCTGVFTGVWNFAVSKTRSAKLLPCFDHIPLRGRLVYVLYDADARTNADVQDALGRLVARLGERGARVLVVYVPPINGDLKTGVDDYLAAGGDLAALELGAEPYRVLDTRAERLTKDERLRARVGELWQLWREMPATLQPECSDRATWRDFVMEAEERGKVHPEGVRVIRPSRKAAKATARSLAGWKASVDRLEAAGRLRRDYKHREKAGAYILLTPSGGGRAESEHNGERDARGESQEREVREKHTQENPLRQAAFTPTVHSLRASSEEVPELRWSKVILWWALKDGKRRVVDSLYVPRLGKRRREMIVYLLAAGGAAPLGDLWEVFATGGERKRPRDFRRRAVGPLEESGIFAVEGERVALRDGWLEALEERRHADDEIRDAERQAERYAEATRKYRLRHVHTPDPTPELTGKEAVAESLERHRPKWEAEEIEDEREKVGMTAAVFLADEMASVRGLRWHELSERWVDQGGKREMLRQAVFSGPYRFQREEVDDHLYVYHAPAAEPRSAPVVVARSETERPAETPITARGRPMPYKNHEGIYVHPPDCGCEWCDEGSSIPPVLKVVSDEESAS
jgi:hypothetical protein